MTAMATPPLAPLSEGERRSNRPFNFVSTCSVCGEARMQSLYPRRALFRLLEKAQTIHAYCETCDRVWPISARERVVIVRAINDQLGAEHDAGT
jgi:hypothetical protein